MSRFVSRCRDGMQWARAISSAGGRVSFRRQVLVSRLVRRLKAAGTWALHDDIFLHAAENEVQALTSLKQRRLGSAVDAPTFTADRGYAFNGTSQYADTGFIADTHKVAMTGSDMRVSAYERTNVNSTGYTAGALTGSTSNIRIRSRNGANAEGNLNSNALSAANADSRGMVAFSRTAAGVFEGFYRGASIGTTVPSTGTSLPTHSFYIGAQNNAGTAAGFRAALIALATVGASFSAAQEAAEYVIWQDYLTAIGAQI